MRAPHWLLRARKHRHLRIAKLRRIKRITAGLMDIHVSRNGGDGQNLNLGRAQRHDQRNGIIGSCIGINQKWTFHATQDNKLSRETRRKNPRNLGKLAACAETAVARFYMGKKILLAADSDS